MSYLFLSLRGAVGFSSRLVYLITYFLLIGLDKLFLGIGEGIHQQLSPVLWGFNFIFGSAIALLVRTLFKALRKNKVMTRQYQNNYLLSRISGFSFDLMIICGIALIDIENLKGLWLPFILMSVTGAGITLLYLKWVCKKIYPNYYL